MKKICLSLFTTILLVLLAQTMLAQNLAPVFVAAPLNSPNTSGVYYNFTSITLGPGFSTQPGLIFQAEILPAGCIPMSNYSTGAQNFIMTTVPRISGFTNPGMLLNPSTCTVMQNIQYLDGLGRPMQAVEIKASPAFNDVVQPFAYDAYGREASKYLPYSTSSNDGSYKPDALTPAAGQALFYSSPPSGVTTIRSPMAQAGFEPSPLNRVAEQGAPGNPWQLSTSGVSGAGATVKVTYTNNDQSVFSSAYTAGTPNPGSRKVIFYSATINGDGSRLLFNNSTYANSLLSVIVTADENWTLASGCLNTTEDYKDEMSIHPISSDKIDLRWGPS